MHVNKFRCFPPTKRSAGNHMLWNGNNKTGSELSFFFTENRRKKFIIVIHCDFKGSQTQVLIIKKFFKIYFLLVFDRWYITKCLLTLTSGKQYVLWSHTITYYIARASFDKIQYRTILHHNTEKYSCNFISRIRRVHRGVHWVHVHPIIRYDKIKEWKTAVQVGTTNFIVDIFRLFQVFLSILLFLKIYK